MVLQGWFKPTIGPTTKKNLSNVKSFHGVVFSAFLFLKFHTLWDFILFFKHSTNQCFSGFQITKFEFFWDLIHQHFTSSLNRTKPGNRRVLKCFYAHLFFCSQIWLNHLTDGHNWCYITNLEKIPWFRVFFSKIVYT